MDKIETRLDEILGILKSTAEKSSEAHTVRFKGDVVSDTCYRQDGGWSGWWKWIAIAVVLGLLFYYFARPYFIAKKPHATDTKNKSSRDTQNRNAVNSLEDLINLRKKQKTSQSVTKIEEIKEPEKQKETLETLETQKEDQTEVISEATDG